jgi:hypothetical protein
MDLISPWLDPAEVRRLASLLTMPEREIPSTSEEAGFGEQFVGFSVAQNAALPTAQALGANRTAEMPDPLFDRFDRLAEWVKHHFSATGVFILDAQGCAIFDDGVHRHLHFFARGIAQARLRPGTVTGYVHVKIDALQVLEVIPAETPHGWFVLGALFPEKLAASSITAITQALGSVTAPPGEDPA